MAIEWPCRTSTWTKVEHACARRKFQHIFALRDVDLKDDRIRQSMICALHPTTWYTTLELATPPKCNMRAAKPSSKQISVMK